jgi:hypothetical protein
MNGSLEILIVTSSEDLHALSVQAALRRRRIPCAILETDELSGNESLSFSIGQRFDGNIRSSEGIGIPLASVGVVWWRRPKAPQQVDESSLTGDQISLINNDCIATLVGLFENCFRGKWISHVRATEFASNKLNQLTAAQRCGFRIPDTLISQSPRELAEFTGKHSAGVIIKPVAGTPGPLIFTQFVSQRHLAAIDSIKACPAIYQEFIPGSRHLRVNCFGERSFAGLIQSESLDWRPNLDVPISRFAVPDWLNTRIRQVLDLLGLEMGIVDLKETPDGEVVWLEVNPQGQFLFLEGLTGEPLTELFADYLSGELCKVAAEIGSRDSDCGPRQRLEIPVDAVG